MEKKCWLDKINNDPLTRRCAVLPNHHRQATTKQFDNTLKDGQKSKKRDLTQYTNPSNAKPKVDDLLIFDGTTFNKYGHVAIISNVTEKEIEIIQQNPGPFSKPRETSPLDNKDEKWEIKNKRILGWLRKD